MDAIASSAPDITVPQAAERKGVSAKTVRRWIADGTLPAYRVGQKLIRIRVADLDAVGTLIGPGSR